jgi:hypothetical protein
MLMSSVSYLMRDFCVDQVVRDEFMNDTDAESQALAAQCLQVLLPATLKLQHAVHIQGPCCIAELGQEL